MKMELVIEIKFIFQMEIVRN